MNQKLIEAFGREAQALRRLAKSGSNRKLVEHLVAVYERGLRDGVQLAEELRNAQANSFNNIEQGK